MFPATMRAHLLCLWTLPVAPLVAIPPQAAVAGRMELETLAGSIESRPLGGAKDPDWTLGPQAFAFARYVGPRPAASPRAAWLETVDGERWWGELRGGDGDRLRWEAGQGRSFDVSIDSIARLEFPARAQASERAAFAPAGERDRLYWRHGEALERIDGTFEAFSAEGIRVDGVLGNRVFPWAEVVALFVAQLDEPAPSAVPGVPITVDLADGSHFRGSLGFVGPNSLAVVSRIGGRFELAYPTILEAALDDGSFLPLSRVPVAASDDGSLFGDEFGLRWPHRVDRAVDGAALSVNGESFARGIGVHAPSRLEWDVSGLGARALTGKVGIDDSVLRLPSRGCVRFQVWIDGEQRWDSGLVRGGEAAKPMPRVNLEGAKRLALVVDPAEDSFVADRADWLRLILIRQP